MVLKGFLKNRKANSIIRYRTGTVWPGTFEHQLLSRNLFLKSLAKYAVISEFSACFLAINMVGTIFLKVFRGLTHSQCCHVNGWKRSCRHFTYWREKSVCWNVRITLWIDWVGGYRYFAAPILHRFLHHFHLESSNSA